MRLASMANSFCRASISLKRGFQADARRFGQRVGVEPPIDLDPLAVVGALRRDDEGRVLGHDLVRGEIVHAVHELLELSLPRSPAPCRKTTSGYFAWRRNPSA